MLWQKESNDPDAMYVDLLASKSNTQPEEDVKKIGKNDQAAHEYRKDGNQKLKKEIFYDAMKLFNKSLCFAENGSEAMGLAYASRSAWFFQKKMFKKCLTDMELAKENNYPERLMHKLESRKIKCQKLMETEEDAGEVADPKLSYEPNEMFPCLANVVDIRNNAEFGRHIVATEAIGVGETIMVEPCYYGDTLKNRYKLCNICLKENGNFIPCKKCTQALFCPECFENDLHGIDCGLGIYIGQLRLIAMVKNAFSNADELIAFVEDIVKDGDKQSPPPLLDPRAKYRAFFQLLLDCEKCKEHQIHHDHRLIAYRLNSFILADDAMAKFFHTRAHKRFLVHLINYHINLTEIHFRGIKIGKGNDFS